MGFLDERIALVTGASRGLGLAVSETLLKHGAHVVMFARSESLEDEGERLQAAYPLQHVHVFRGDATSHPTVQTAVEYVTWLHDRLDVLVCCAGVYGPMGPLDTISPGDWRNALDVNLWGTMLFCREVLPQMRSQNYGKIIVLSGGGATKPLPMINAYATSKAAVVGFAATLAAELADTGIDVNSVSPGALNTAMLDEVLQAGPGKVGNVFFEQAVQQKRSGGNSVQNAAECICYLASSACDGITGRLISAVWDNWQYLRSDPELKHPSNRYTMRRVTS